MKIGIFTRGELGPAGRGIGTYTKLLFDELKRLSQKENFEVELIDSLNQKVDIVHYPYFDFYFSTLHHSSNLPFVVTVHDTIPLIYPKHYPAGVKGRLNFFKQKRSLQHASAIVTDSETSKKDIVRDLSINAEKIFPIYLGPTKKPVKQSLGVVQKIQDKYDINFPYFVYIGDVNWNKNVVGLAEACDAAQQHLVIIGKKAISTDYDHGHIENKPLFDLQQRFGKSNYIHRIGFVEDNEAAILIQNSIALCQPSFYEGFGLNVLDAMNLGVPTICGKTQTLVEIYEEASVFFDPYDKAEAQEILTRVAFDKNLQKQLIQKGLKHAKQFSWKETASQTLDVYRKVFR